ncbi:co-chaperone YbbN [Streptomyces sp. NBC_00893]|uniref:thioredoxin family protein n=1 Tax=Streptomyces sp. NBC_00893 TaxID=2975862 RepID=UPI00225070E6|nr:thioredoxin family protein [Streptomyces sp. NBC_00893]MCX4850681.1 thioredoxin family protein [Streptomyces sp. NBC_00893]
MTTDDAGRTSVSGVWAVGNVSDATALVITAAGQGAAAASAEWCGPCIRVTPIVEQVAAEHAGVLDVVKVNVDEEPGLAGRHGISSNPAFVVYADGAPAKAWTGTAPKPLLERSLGPFLR